EPLLSTNEVSTSSVSSATMPSLTLFSIADPVTTSGSAAVTPASPLLRIDTPVSAVVPPAAASIPVVAAWRISRLEMPNATPSMVNPSLPAAAEKLRTVSLEPAPTIVTGSSISGSAESRLYVPAGIVIVSAPAVPFASEIACRSDQMPLSGGRDGEGVARRLAGRKQKQKAGGEQRRQQPQSPTPHGLRLAPARAWGNT